MPPSHILCRYPHGAGHDAQVGDADADQSPRPLKCDSLDLFGAGGPAQGHGDGDGPVNVVVDAGWHGARVEEWDGGTYPVHASGNALGEAHPASVNRWTDKRSV